MKVTVIIPAFNSAKFIKKTIESVQQQSFKNLEIIIVDDVSTDNTLEIVEELKKEDNRIKIFPSTIKLYTAGARNVGIANSTGKYIAFIDSDDLWNEHKLQKQIDFLYKNNYHFCYTGVTKVDIDLNQIAVLDVPKSITYKELLQGNKVCCSSVVLHVDCLKNLEFDAKIKIVEDYALWLKILRKNNISAFGINEPLTYYRVHQSAKSRNKLISSMDTWKVLRYSEKLSILKSIVPFLFYIKDGFRKLLAN